MAIYRTIQMSFWTDTDVLDDFTPEDRYFYLYLLTNPHTNLCGCYQISMTQFETEMGYNKDTISKLIDRFKNIHKLIDYSKETKEVLLTNWHKYNWTKSPKFIIPLQKEIENVKNDDFRQYLQALFQNSDTVSIPYAYPMHTTVTDTDTDIYNNSLSLKDISTKDIKDKDIDINYINNKEPRINYKGVVDSYNEICSSLPKCTKITESRKLLIKTRLKDYSEADLLKAFELAEQSDFLSGRNGKWTGANIDWILNVNNIQKILEGNYKNKGSEATGKPKINWDKV